MSTSAITTGRMAKLPRTWPMLAVAVVAMMLTAVSASHAGLPQWSLGRVVFWWLAGILFLVIAASDGTSLTFPRPSMRSIVAWTAMTAIAAIPRFVMLDRFPTVLDADEAAFMVQALEFRNGELANPFATGYFSTPQGYMALQGLMADAVGGGTWTYRIPSAMIGTIGVLAAWRLGVRFFGELAGALAGVILATMPLHLHFSRNALNNVTDPTFLALGLLFGLRALDNRRQVDALAAGISLGLAFHGYYGGRALWLMVLIVLIAVAVLERTPLRSFLTTVGWLLAGFIAVALPLIMAFWGNPAEFGGHLSQVSSISLEAFRDDPVSTGSLYVENLRDAIIYPMWGDPSGFFRHGRPFIGWELAVLVVVGLGAILYDAIRRRVSVRLVVVAMPYILLVAGIALAIPLASQRYMSVTPLLAITAGVGMAALARAAAWLAPSRGNLIRAVLAIAVVSAVGYMNLRWMASEDRQLETYGDLRTTMMWGIGWRIREGDGGVSRLLLAGAPYVFAYGFPNLAFLAPEVVQEDVPGQFLTGGGAPDLADDAILVLVPERAGERCAIEHAYPDATVAEARARDGSLLYVAFFPGTADGFSPQETPAETTLTVVTTSPCPALD